MRLIMMASRAQWLSRVCGARAYSVDRHARHVDFTNTKEAYRFKSFGELCRSYLVYRLFDVDVAIRNSHTLLKWGERILGRSLFEWFMKKTVYGQFVGGESISTLKPTTRQLSKAGINSILDYAVEEDVPDTQPIVMETRHPKVDGSEHAQYRPIVGGAIKTAPARTHFYTGDDRCEQNLQHFLDCINTAADVTEAGRPFAAIKLTGLGRVEFLLRLSKTVNGGEEMFRKLTGNTNIVNAQLNMDSLQRGLTELGVVVSESQVEELFHELDTDGSGSISYQEWLNQFQPSRQLHQVLREAKGLEQVIPTLDNNEVQQMKDVIKRARRLADCATERGVGLMVDAEQTYFQPAIRHIVVNILMPEFNVGPEPVVYNTVQCYLKNAESSLMCDLALSDVAGFAYGVKLVRGAYITQEREKAKSEGYPDPIWPNIEATHHCYNKLLKMLIHKAKTGNAHIVIASHNQQSIEHAINSMIDEGLSPETHQVVFGQLLGMCDYLTYPLGQSGYQAYKYVPYGPVAEVLPYLVRRAHENSSLLDSVGAKTEKKLLRAEIWRRIKTLGS